MHREAIADALNSEEAIAAYWRDVVKAIADRPNVVAAALSEIAHARTVSQVADEMGLSREDLWAAINGNWTLSVAMLNKATDALGLEPVDLLHS